MKLSLTSHKWKLIIATLLGASTLAYCAPADWFGLRKPDFELTGQVLDFDTKQPIEGAYVLAVYEKVDLGIAGAARYCVKTKGMTSDKEGRFHFPVERLDSNSPSIVHAIKSDYFLQTWKLPKGKSVEAQDKETYSDWRVYLKKQDAAKPDFQYGFIGCYRPESNEAIEAAIQFTKIEMSEQIKYGRDGKNPAEGIELMQRAASRAEPTNQPNKK
jgi:hypothetical protein